MPEMLIARADAVAERMFELAVQQVPAYRALSESELLEFRRHHREGFLSAMQLWREGRLATPDELASHRAIGATRASEGLPLPAVLRAYRMGTIAIFEYAISDAGLDLDVEEIANITRLILGYGDQMANELTIGYTEASEFLRSHQGRARRELLDDLLAGRFSAQEAITDRAAILGIELPNHPTLLLARLVPGANPNEDLNGRVLRLRELLSDASLALVSRGNIVVLSDRPDVSGLRTIFKNTNLFGVVTEAESLGAIPEAYERALAVLKLLQSRRIPHRTLIAEDEAALISEFANLGSGVARAAFRSILGSLTDPSRSDLLETLDAYLGTGNAASAAQILGVHPQTMRYRLRRIEELTGRDPTGGWDRFILELSLRGHRITST